MRILVVCGAGASSTFVAQRLRTAAAASGLDWAADAGVESTVALGGHDLVLVGPHLRDRLDAIRGLTGAPVAVLPDDVFTDREGGRTLLLAQSILAAAGEAPKGTP
ncbi:MULTISPECIES: PTS sugar transporter subunit IIB [Microbacterium]|uniref:PTS sugar transporter subunit IIB n=1 Tax=Microbacterium TaxID=33882 RepID=UPI0011EA746D|nr:MULTISPECIES: hypothetical protein [Microbacterium]